MKQDGLDEISHHYLSPFLCVLRDDDAAFGVSIPFLFFIGIRLFVNTMIPLQSATTPTLPRWDGNSI